MVPPKDVQRKGKNILDWVNPVSWSGQAGVVSLGLALWLVCVVVFVVGGKPEWVLGCSRVVANIHLQADIGVPEWCSIESVPVFHASENEHVQLVQRNPIALVVSQPDARRGERALWGDHSAWRLEFHGIDRRPGQRRRIIQATLLTVSEPADIKGWRQAAVLPNDADGPSYLSRIWAQLKLSLRFRVVWRWVHQAESSTVRLKYPRAPGFNEGNPSYFRAVLGGVSSPERGPQSTTYQENLKESYNYEQSRKRTKSLLYRYLPLAVLALLVQLFGWGLLLRDGDLERLFGVLLIGIGVVCLGSVLGKWAFGSGWYFWSLRWLW
jgi:hypothetical protein